MKQKRSERAEQTKIVSPLARYNTMNQLICVVCKIIIKSDALWESHCQSAPHKKNILLLKEAQSKKRKRDNSNDDELAEGQLPDDIANTHANKKAKVTTNVTSQSDHPPVVVKEVQQQQEVQQQTKQVRNEKTQPPPNEPLVLPQGFFDDPSKQLLFAEKVTNEASAANYVSLVLDSFEISEEQRALEELSEHKKIQEQQNVVFEEEIIEEEEQKETQNIPEDLSTNPKIDTEEQPLPKLNKSLIPLDGYEVHVKKPSLVIDEYNELKTSIDAEMIRDTLDRRKAFTTLQDLKEQVTKIKTQKPLNSEKPTLSNKNMETDSDLSDDSDEMVDWRSKGF